MNKQESISEALRGPLGELALLGDWFERQQRILPWREQPSVYRVWISEIMLQQTQVATVVPYFEKFLARFPSVEVLAHAPLEEVLLHWAGLGYYSRARNIHRAAQLFASKGAFPKTREEWLEVPGVGEYTAGAILSIAMNLPEAILDGNVERVLSRVQRISRAQGDAIYKSALWNLSRKVVETSFGQGIAPRVINQALMELGARICTPRSPKCLLCPLQSGCDAHRLSEEEIYPPKKKPKDWILVKEQMHCLINEEGRVLVRLRENGEWRSGLFDLLTEAPSAEASQRKTSFVGDIESKHVVTRHKITRKTSVWKVKSPALWSAAEGESASEKNKWITPFAPEVAIGSALKKTLQQIRETYPEVWPASSGLREASFRSD